MTVTNFPAFAGKAQILSLFKVKRLSELAESVILKVKRVLISADLNVEPKQVVIE